MEKQWYFVYAKVKYKRTINFGIYFTFLRKKYSKQIIINLGKRGTTFLNIKSTYLYIVIVYLIDVLAKILYIRIFYYIMFYYHINVEKNLKIFLL